MSEEQGYTNDGDSIKSIPVESKEPTLVSTPAEMSKPETEVKEESVVTPVVEKKKRGRPFKKSIVRGEAVEVVREYYCATCRQHYDDLSVMKMGAGSGRYAIFCNNCQKSLGFSDFAAEETLAKLHKNPSHK